MRLRGRAPTGYSISSQEACGAMFSCTQGMRARTSLSVEPMRGSVADSFSRRQNIRARTSPSVLLMRVRRCQGLVVSCYCSSGSRERGALSNAR